MTLIHPSRDRAEEAMAKAFAEIDRLDQLFNRYDTSSALGNLNADGYLRAMPPEMQEVFTKSLYCHKFSQGAFDITVKPLIDLFQKKMGSDRKGLPTAGSVPDLHTHLA